MSIPDNTFVTVEPDAAGFRICNDVGIVNCYLNPTHTPAADVTDSSLDHISRLFPSMKISSDLHSFSEKHTISLLSIDISLINCMNCISI